MVDGYPVCRLGAVASVQGGFAFKSGDFTETGVPVLKIKNVRLREVDTTEPAYVDLSVAKDTARYFCKTGDLLISMTGSGPQAPNSVVGRVARFTGPKDRYLINQRVGRFVNKAPESRPALSLLRSRAGRDTLEARVRCHWQRQSGEHQRFTNRKPPSPAPTPRRAKSHRGGAWGAGRQDRVEPADERDAGGDGAGAVPELVRGFRPRPRQTRRPPPRRPRPSHRRPLPRHLPRLRGRSHPERLEQSSPSAKSSNCVGGGTPSTAEPKYWEGGTHHWTTPKDFSSTPSARAPRHRPQAHRRRHRQDFLRSTSCRNAAACPPAPPSATSPSPRYPSPSIRASSR